MVARWDDHRTWNERRLEWRGFKHAMRDILFGRDSDKWIRHLHYLTDDCAALANAIKFKIDLGFVKTRAGRVGQ